MNTANKVAIAILTAVSLFSATKVYASCEYDGLNDPFGVQQRKCIEARNERSADRLQDQMNAQINANQPRTTTCTTDSNYVTTCFSR